MQNEFGGYLPLELGFGNEYIERFKGAKFLRLNCGRNAIAAAVLATKPAKIYIPYYNCNVVIDTLALHGITYERYFIDENLDPVVDAIEPDAWLLYVNYFGSIAPDQLRRIKEKYQRVIFDNTQAFFADPLLDENTFNVYSCRKFVGVCDGAYLVWGGNREIHADYPREVSWDRAAFLFKSLELGTNAAYQDNLNSKADFGSDVRAMSLLSEKMLASYDYDKIRAIRHSNFQILQEALKGLNQFWLPFKTDTMFVYPLYVENSELRKALVSNKVYVPQWWKYLLDIVPQDSIEARLSKWILPLPIDQRYSEKDMRQLAALVKECVKQSVSHD